MVKSVTITKSELQKIYDLMLAHHRNDENLEICISDNVNSGIGTSVIVEFISDNSEKQKRFDVTDYSKW